MPILSMPQKSKELLLVLCAVVAIGFGISIWLGPRSQNVSLRMSAGAAAGLRHSLALEIARESEKAGISIVVVPTQGSEETLDKVNSGELHIGLVQGGLSHPNLSAVRQVSPMHVEPLHLLVRGSRLEGIASKGLAGLEGGRVNIGPKGSGTSALAVAVMKFADLAPSKGEALGTYHPSELTYEELLLLPEEQLPDAVFTVSSLPSPVADELIQRFGYKLVELPFGEAFSAEAFLELGQPQEVGGVDKRYAYATEIPDYMYGFQQSTSRGNIKTLGTRLLMVANKDVKDATIERLLESLYASSFAKMERPGLDSQLLDIPCEYPIHTGSERYRQRNKPLIAGDFIDWLEKVLAILATVAGGSFFLFQWYWQRRKRKQDNSFAKFMERIIAIEQESLQNEVAATPNLSELIRLQRELAELKSQALRGFADGKLEGEGMLHDFLVLVNDARDQVTRLLLHERDNIEEFAKQQNRTPEELWKEHANQNFQKNESSSSEY